MWRLSQRTWLHNRSERCRLDFKSGFQPQGQARFVWQRWRSEAGATLLVLCKSLMESKPAVGFEPTTA